MILVKTMAITKVKCGKCNHLWLPRTEKRPKQCPECGSASWDEGSGGESDSPPSWPEVRRWMPAELLTRADAIAKGIGISFGELVIQALEEELLKQAKPKQRSG